MAHCAVLFWFCQTIRGIIFIDSSNFSNRSADFANSIQILGSQVMKTMVTHVNTLVIPYTFFHNFYLTYYMQILTYCTVISLLRSGIRV